VCSVARIGALVLSVALVTLFALPAGSAAEPSRAAKELFFKLSVVSEGDAGTVRSTEWISDRTGLWRIEEQRRVSILTIGEQDETSDRSYGVYEAGEGWSVKAGSARFLGSVKRPVALEALLAYTSRKTAEQGIEVTTSQEGRTELRFRARGKSVVATILERNHAVYPRTSPLLRIPEQQIVRSETERYPGAAPEALPDAYWFGVALGRRELVTVVERTQRRPARRSFTLYYELPAARRKSSALPGQRAPAGEVRVVSTPRAGPLPARGRFVLRTGEPTRLLIGPRGFSVTTKTTLVTVSGRFRTAEVRPLARWLRPLA